MNNNAVLTILSDAIDLQKQTLEVLKEAVAVLKAAVEEMQASRNLNITTPQYVPPTYVPYNPPVTFPQPYVWPNTKPWGDSTIICKGDYGQNGTTYTQGYNSVVTNTSGASLEGMIGKASIVSGGWQGGKSC